MIFAFRVDASSQIGGGHVMRCLTLADALRQQGATCNFYCCPQPGDRISTIADQGYAVTSVDQYEDLPDDLHPDWLVTDHYQLDAAWEMRQRATRRLVIDDLANRPHHCDLLLDQNLHRDAEARYRSLTSPNCQLLLGPQHVLLRPAFTLLPKSARNGMVRHIFIYFGSNDQDNQAGRALEALAQFPQLTAEVVLGPDHPHREALLIKSKIPGVVVTETCTEMATAMARADLALGVCGIAAWERCALGLPTLVCVTADNQREDAENLQRLGAVEHLGRSEEVSAKSWASALNRALADPARIAHMGRTAAAVVSGYQKNQTSLINLLLNG